MGLFFLAVDLPIYSLRAAFSFCAARQNCITPVVGTTTWHRFTNYSSSFDVASLFIFWWRKPHGLGLHRHRHYLRLPLLLTQLPYEFQHTLTKGRVGPASSSSSRSASAYLRIIYRASWGQFRSERSQRAAVYGKMHVTDSAWETGSWLTCN